MEINKRLLVIFILAFLIRLIALNQSLWLDEATTAKAIQQFSVPDIITKFSPNDFHPPLYYLFMKIWSGIFGFSEISLRLPSVLFSLLTGFLVYRLGKLIKNESTGFWSCVFFLFNPLIVYYSQEARMYLMTTFLLTAVIIYLIKMLQIKNSKIKTQNWKNSVLFTIFTVLSLLTFYGSIFFFVSIAIYLLFKKKYKILILILLTVTVTLLILSPLLYRQMSNARLQISMITNWKQVLGTTSLKNLFLIPLKFSIGKVSYDPKWFYWLTAGLWTSFIFYFTVRGSFKNKFIGYLLVFPVILGFIFSYFSPLLQYFRFLYLIPILSILSVLGSARSHLPGVRWVIVTGYIFWSLLYLLNPAYQREDWKSLVLSLPENADIFIIASSSDPVRYYLKNPKITDLKSLPDKITRHSIYVIPYTADIHGVDYAKVLKKNNLKLDGSTSFRELILERWSR